MSHITSAQREDLMNIYLIDSSLPKLSCHKKLYQINLDEKKIFNRALKSLPVRKAPGPDGFILFYLKKCNQTLAPKFTSAFNSVLKGDPIPKDTSHLHINNLLKSDKDPSLCVSYRPISLLHTDLKLFTKIMTIRLLHYLERIINIDQSGFVSDRGARDNTIKSLNIIYLCKSTKIPAMLLSTDANRAFDRVSWRFI